MSFNFTPFPIFGRFLLQTIFIWVLSPSLYAQFGPTHLGSKLSEIVPPSPNAASLAKYGDIPVSYHTGLPDITVPLYQWSNKNAALTFSASLNYHGGGVKVDEIASNVGLGWSLSAGGNICRVMRGLPDESEAGFLHTDTLPNVATTTYLGEFLYGVAAISGTYPESKVIKSTNSNFGLVSNIYNSTTDSEQDIFYYNFNGKSGKFYLGKDGSVVTQQKDNLKITKISNGSEMLAAFQVTDDQGNIYLFDQQEITNSYHTTISTDADVETSIPVAYTSCWYLSSIKPAAEEYEIKFDYVGYAQNYTSGFSAFTSFIASDDFSTEPYDGLRTKSSSNSYSTTQVTGKTIRQISFPDSVKMIFDYGTTPRSDVNGDYPLVKITLSHQGKIKGYHLQQSYFDNSNTAISGYLRKRLRLDQVTEFGEGNVLLPAQKFYYNELELPARGSFHQDYWGYAVNPARNNLTLIPKMSYLDPVDGYYNPYNELLQGSNREADSIYVKAASLSRIDYPGGGQSLLDFECNDAYGDFESVEPVTNSVTVTTPNSPISLGDIVATGTTVRFSLGITESGPRPPNDPPAYFEEDITNQPVSFILEKADHSWSSTIYTGTYGNLLHLTHSFQASIPGAGAYQIYMQYGNPFGINFLAAVSATYYVEKNRRLIGGLRIKSIADQTSSSSGAVNVRNFEYKTTGNQSSGKVPQFPLYDFYRTVEDVYTNGWVAYLGSTEILNRVAESTQPLGVIQGSPVGYSRVTVSFSPAKGKTVYEYTPLIYFDYNTHYPYKNGEYINWGAGLPTKEYTYDHNNVLKHSIDHTYQLVYNNLISGQHRSLKIGQVYSDSYHTNTRKGYTASVSYPVLGYANLIQSIERVYDGSTYVQTQTNINYDSQYNLPVETRVTTNLGTKTLRNYYPFQYTGVPVFQNMTTANIINKIIKQENWETYTGHAQSYLTDAYATAYTTLGYHARAFRPWVSSHLRVSEPLALDPVSNFNAAVLLTPAANYETQITYDGYSADKGVLTNYTVEGAQKKSLVWGLNQLYLKASAENAAETEVFYEDFEDSGSGTTGAGHSGKKYYSGDYSVSWTIPNSRAYEITYWYLDAGIWKFARQGYTGSVVLNAGTAIDDVLIYPKTGKANGWYADPFTGLMSQTDENGKITYYEYDDFLRLKNVKDQNGYLIRSNTYNYQP